MTTYQTTNAVAGSTQEVTKMQYTAKTYTSGGRRGGVSRSDDGRLDVKFSSPVVPGTGTNPEQLLPLAGQPVSLVRWGLWPIG
jgi:lipoyl-dependent peroxiredoxin